MGEHRANGLAPDATEVKPMAPEQTLPSQARRDTAWKKDGKAKGIYFRLRANGEKSWGFYAEGKIHPAISREVAIDAKADARLRKSKGLPPQDTNVLIRDLGEEVRETKRRRHRPGRFSDYEAAMALVLGQLGDFRVTAVGPERCARLIRDLEDGKVTGNKLGPATVRKYLAPLAAILKLAARRGIIASNPLMVLGEDERPSGGGRRDHYEWSSEEISALIAASEELARQPEARYDYSPIIRVLVLLGLRIGEALALQKRDVDLLGAVLHIRHSGGRRGEKVSGPKTDAGIRDVPLSPGLVDLFARVIPVEAGEDDFIFHVKGNSKRPLSYWNFRNRGFVPALVLAGLGGNGIVIHSLRSAAVSIYASKGLTLAETADVMGQADPLVTWKHYLKMFDRSKVADRIRAAQTSALEEDETG
jgi:integrase